MKSTILLPESLEAEDHLLRASLPWSPILVAMVATWRPLTPDFHLECSDWGSGITCLKSLLRPTDAPRSVAARHARYQIEHMRLLRKSRARRLLVMLRG